MSDYVVLRTYPDRLHAELARSFLEAEGIETLVSSPSQMPGSYLIAEFGDGMVPHELKVAKEDLADAEAALAETEDIVWTDDEDVDASGDPVAQPGVPEGTCSACGGPKAEDDPGIRGVRIVVLCVLAMVFLLAVTMVFLPGAGAALIGGIAGMILLPSAMYARYYFMSKRCAYCGHRRMAR
jgi:hypothetical protein